MDKEEIKRPITLYVDEVVTEIPDMKHLKSAPRRTVDLEMSKDQAIKLHGYLTRRIRGHVGGNIRARCKGHLVI